MFSDTVLYEAAHVIYANQFADALERRGGHFPGGQNLCNYVPALTPAEHDPIIRPAMAKIDKALGTPLADVFTRGGIVDEVRQRRGRDGAFQCAVATLPVGGCEVRQFALEAGELLLRE